MIIDIAEWVASHHLTIITVPIYYRFHDKNFLGNHKCTASHYIINNYCQKYIEIQSVQKCDWLHDNGILNSHKVLCLAADRILNEKIK